VTEHAWGWAGELAEREDVLLSTVILGLLLCRPVVVDNHKHVALAELWNVRFPTPLSEARGPQGLVTAAIAAAGPVPYREALKWFPWSRADAPRAYPSAVRA
jgi:hypothetical protein